MILYNIAILMCQIHKKLYYKLCYSVLKLVDNIYIYIYIYDYYIL